MTKFCPSCGNKSADLLNYCWNCGQFLGKGHVDELETKESAEKTRSELNLDKRTQFPENEQYVNQEDTSISLVTIYGVTKNDLKDLLEKNSIQVDYVDMPGLCKADEAVTKHDLAREKYSTTSHSGGGSSYYYNDPTSSYCCYYACLSSSSSSRSNNNNCDCNDSGSDSDNMGAFIVILVIIVLIALIVIAGPTIFAAGLVIVDIAIAIALLVFNVLTLGIYKDDLSRTRIRIRSAKSNDLNNFMRELNGKRGLPRMHGYWTKGFVLIRYGALFFITGLILVFIMIAIQPGDKTLYYLPVAIIIISIFTFFLGNFLINKKLREIQTSFLN